MAFDPAAPQQQSVQQHRGLIHAVQRGAPPTCFIQDARQLLARGGHRGVERPLPLVQVHNGGGNHGPRVGIQACSTSQPASKRDGWLVCRGVLRGCGGLGMPRALVGCWQAATYTCGNIYICAARHPAGGRPPYAAVPARLTLQGAAGAQRADAGH